MKTEGNFLELKWGTVKSYDLTSNPTALKLMEEYFELDTYEPGPRRAETDKQKELLCRIIEAVGGNIYLSWDAKYASVQGAKDYVMNYGKERV